MISQKTDLRFMHEAENLKANTLSLHFKIEELYDRLQILCKFRMVQETEEAEYKKVLKGAELTLGVVRQMLEKFDQLNFTPFVNQNQKEALARKIRH